MRSSSIIKISLAVLLFIAPAFTQDLSLTANNEPTPVNNQRFDNVDQAIDDAQVIADEAAVAYKTYLTCVGSCGAT